MSTASHSPNLTLPPLVVVVTGAAGNIGSTISFMIASGNVFGERTVDLRLLDLPFAEKSLNGLVMELEDVASPFIAKIVPTFDVNVAFDSCDVALLIGARPRGPGMERKDLLTANAKIFIEQGKALDQLAKRDVKVLVVGNPANTNALIAMTNAPSLPKTAFSALTRLDQNRAVSVIASKAGVSVSQVKNVIIWGNHSSTQYPSVSHGYIVKDGKQESILSSLPSLSSYFSSSFLSQIQGRGAAIIAAASRSAVASAAAATVDHIRNWMFGTKEGEYVSMAVASDGSYGIPEGLIFSFPCTCQNGQYKIVNDFTLNEFDQSKIDITTKELLEEKEQAGF